MLGPVLGRDYLGGAGAWGAITACYGGGSMLGALLALGRRPRRPVAAATAATLGFGLPCALLALGGPLRPSPPGPRWPAPERPWRRLGTAAEQQRLPAGVLARVSAFQMVIAFAFGPLAFAAAGPVAAVAGARAVLAFGARLVHAGVLRGGPAIPAVRAVSAPPRRTPGPD